MCGGWESILRRPEACYNAQQQLPCPKDLVYSSSRTSLLVARATVVFLEIEVRGFASQESNQIEIALID